MQQVPLPKILSISYGADPKNDFGYRMNQTIRLGNEIFTISNIERDENNFHLFGNLRYIIYVVRPNTKEEKIWKIIENMPLTLTFDFNSAETI